MGYSLTLVVVCCLSPLSVESLLEKVDKKDSDFIWLQPGEMQLLSDDQNFQTPNGSKSYTIMRSGSSKILSLYCSYYLPCREGAKIEYYDEDYNTVEHCSDSWKATPIIKKSVSLMIDFKSGTAGNGKYHCIVINDKECTSSTTTKTTTTIETTTIGTTTTEESSTTTASTTIAATIIPPTNLSCQCGTLSQTKIVGGDGVEDGQIPWQVGLGREYNPSFKVFCGGTLLNDRYVLTAAHCITKPDSSIKIMLGSVRRLSSTITVASISKFISHESYGTPLKHSNDIGLIVLSTPVTYSDTIFPACLPKGFSDDFFVGKTLTISGWGYLREGLLLVEPVLLRKTEVKGISDETCRKHYSKKLGEGMMCAYEVGKDTCQGDSGGPLTFTDGPITYLAGVTSFGEGCARPGVPGVYSKVTYYLNWIDSKTDKSICSKTN